MAIKSKISGQKARPRYPVLRQSINYKTVVLFSKLGEGTVVYQGDGQWEVGHHSSSWSEVSFRDWDGTITLNNKG